ncbi:methyltransferase [Thermogemmatispora sp.]|uniref:methyltransferase n=1 Tax=Thermogemmatispora sp. TaxID=1968838 RepID=UPI001D35772C|nr:methyltransferase [Thermogemmatispora sp.]MBX5452032.1 radical SAM protein [Thermogemmatispora sp.]
MKELEVFDVVITGGEPLLLKGIFEVLQHAKSLGLYICLNTNGTIVTPRIAQRLRDIGVDCVKVSIDSANAAVHDRFRGQVGAFRRSLSPFHTLLDIGGGAGTCSIALCLAYPHLHATIFDLPGTLPMTQQMTQQANLQDRINLIAGDVTKDGLPGIYDAVLVSHVVHWLDEEQISLLFNKVSTALEDHGMVLVRDFFLETSKTAPRQTAVFSVSLLVQGGSRCYSFDEGATWLTQAGFRRGAEKIPRELILAKKQVRDEDGRETSECGHMG